ELPAVTIFAVPRGETQHTCRAASRIKQPGEHFECGRFARPVRTQKTHQFARLDIEGDLLYRNGLLVSPAEQAPQSTFKTRFLFVGPEVFREAADFNGGHAADVPFLKTTSGFCHSKARTAEAPCT